MIQFIIMVCLLIIVRNPLMKYTKGVWRVLTILIKSIKDSYLTLSGRKNE